MKYLSLNEILILHAYQIENFGGRGGVRDAKLLESAVLRPQSSFDGKDLYKTTEEKAAVLAFGIIKNHPFFDANKRTGMHALLVFLKQNDKNPKLSNKEIVRIGRQIAENKINLDGLLEILAGK